MPVPTQETKPEPWQGLTLNALNDSLKNFTLNLMQALKAAEIEPEWVQIGNETNDRFLWPGGSPQQLERLYFGSF